MCTFMEIIDIVIIRHLFVIIIIIKRRSVITNSNEFDKSEENVCDCYFQCS